MSCLYESKTPLVTVIIPTYNRFSQMCSAVASVRAQTYPNIEIVVVNDASTERAYYENRVDGATMIHLAQNSRTFFGYPCAGYVRNMGARIAAGEYLAFLDDDDVWHPEKIARQMSAIRERCVRMSCTDARIIFNARASSAVAPPSGAAAALAYNGEHYIHEISRIYADAGHPELVNEETGFPVVWTYEMIKIHNCIITSSVVLARDVFKKLGGFNFLRNGEEDWNLWLHALGQTNCVYVGEPCLDYLYSVSAGKHD